MEERVRVTRGTDPTAVWGYIRTADLTVDHLANIYKMNRTTIFLTSGNGDLVFPGYGGYLTVDPSLEYKVCGDNTEAAGSVPAVPRPPPPPTAFPSTSGLLLPPPQRPKVTEYRMDISIGEVQGMDIHEDGSTCIRFTDNEANATSIALKVKCELELEEPVVLLNWKRQRIADSPETHELSFWLSNSRVIAVKESAYAGFMGRKRKTTSATEMREQLQELAQAAQELPAVCENLNEISEYMETHRVTMLPLSPTQRDMLRQHFKCTICMEVMREPVTAPCCRSIIGCRACVQRAVRGNNRCPKCRDWEFGDTYFVLRGMDGLIDHLRDILRD